MSAYNGLANSQGTNEIQALVLLATLVFVIVVEVAGAARNIHLEDLKRNGPSLLKSPGFHIRFFVFHSFSSLLLSITWLFAHYTVDRQPLGVVEPLVMLVFLILPFLEVKEYDYLFNLNSLTQSFKYMISYLIHLIVMVSVWFVVHRVRHPVYAIFLVVPIGTWVFVWGVHRDIFAHKKSKAVTHVCGVR